MVHPPISATLFFTLLAAGLCLQGQVVKPVKGEQEVAFDLGKGARVVTRDEKLIEVKSLHLDTSITAPPTADGNRSQGADFYTFVLAPKEKVSLKLQPEDASRMGMMPVKPMHADKMASQFSRINQMPKSLRSSQFQFENITDAPYTFILMVYGSADFWYKLHIERKP